MAILTGQQRKIRSSNANSKTLTVEAGDDRALLPPPAVFGVQGTHDRFKEWRIGQPSAVLASVDAETRMVIECLPTGAGKTLIYMTEAMMVGGEVVILTSTKGQQDQIIDSVAPMVEAGIVADVRGQMNYRCEAVMPGGEHQSLNLNNEWVPVADGPCQDGAQCSLKEGGCGYYDAIRAAQKAKIKVTNYAFWMTNRRMQPQYQIVNPEKPVDLLVCDEAHETVNEICDFLGTEIEEEDTKVIRDIIGMDADVSQERDILRWRAWAANILARAQSMMEEWIIEGARDRRKVRKVMAKLENMEGMHDTPNWVVDRPFNPKEKRNKVLLKFDPVWPLKYAEPVLFRGSKKVVLSSATVQMKTATLLGFEEKDVTMFEMPSRFPVENRPVYRVPCIQMNYKNEAKREGQEAWVSMVARIISEGREDRQGIIHTVSYKRRNLLMGPESLLEDSLSERMVSHSTLNARTVVAEFISYSTKYPLQYSTSPKILVSPSVTTGYDFKDEAARYQIIPKLPILDTRAKVMKARCEQDVEYGPYYTATTLMQATGRLVRSESDWGETFITDDNIVWFLGKWKRLFTRWWLDAYIDWEDNIAWAARRLPKPRNLG